MSRPALSSSDHRLGLVLGGGGARAAYQAGVLSWIAKNVPDIEVPLLTGVSAGAINAAFLANHAGSFLQATDALAALWGELRSSSVMRVGTGPLSSNAIRWAFRLVTGGNSPVPPPRGMVDTEPLHNFLMSALDTDSDETPLSGVSANIALGRLAALAVTTTNYHNGQSVTWVHGREFEPWQRPFRRSVPSVISVQHVMASSAIPLFFPAVKIGQHWHGDGGVRQTAPLSPALHLGASHILAISTRRTPHARTFPVTDIDDAYPPPAQVLGVLTNAIFLDMFDFDAQNLVRINRLVEHLPPEHADGLRRVQLLVLRPSQDLGLVASAHEFELPGALKFLTRGWGTQETPGADSLAMLMFESGYTKSLMDLGAADAAARGDEIKAFLRGAPAPETPSILVPPTASVG